VDTKGTNYTYTAAGRLATRAWARGVTTTYSYTQGLLTLTDYSDTTPDVAITYDGYSRQSTVTQTNQSQITYSYHPTTLVLASELVKYDLDHNGSYEFTRTLDRSRDTLLRDSGYSLKTANSTLETSSAYSYSPTDGRISQISNPQISNQIFSYGYLANSSLLASLTGPIHTVTNTWEPNRDVLDIKQNKVGSTVISNYDYAVNAIGQRTGVTTSGSAFQALPSWAWSYDALGQVIAADSSVNISDRSYEYDTIGNRQKSANSLTLPVTNNYATKGTNAYSSVQLPGTAAALIPAYDFDGNATAYPLPNAPAANSTLAWDAENRLISTLVSGVTTTYQYDAQSRRIAKIAGTAATTSTATLYLYDAWNCIADYERGTGVSPVLTLKKTRLWGADLSGTPQAAGGVAGLLSESLISNPQSSIYYPTYDGNGNISEYLTATGTTAAHFEYDPFGNTVINTDAGNLFTYRFSTKPRDTETGLYYYGYRYYDPMTGRWPSRDPIEEVGGMNLYGFVFNNGVRNIDLFGLEEKRNCQKISLKLKRKIDANLLNNVPFSWFNVQTSISAEVNLGIETCEYCCGTEWKEGHSITGDAAIGIEVAIIGGPNGNFSFAGLSGSYWLGAKGTASTTISGGFSGKTKGCANTGAFDSSIKMNSAFNLALGGAANFKVSGSWSTTAVEATGNISLGVSGSFKIIGINEQGVSGFELSDAKFDEPDWYGKFCLFGTCISVGNDK
jgi:RHS repeat-associated protein